ncbi:MAG TPA: hypothetical protein PLK31_00980 [Chloroflexota bacterium]|nr:hypothetical protein [Chloroflexota bacterium]
MEIEPISGYNPLMSVQLIQQYHNKVERIIRYGGSHKETAVRTINPYEACYTDTFRITNS